uniref:Uncharacterized protein n=1 Tax=Arundo donax TaxID=35708 RepID=A0A0A9CIG9_ARUDO
MMCFLLRKDGHLLEPVVASALSPDPSFLLELTPLDNFCTASSRCLLTVLEFPSLLADFSLSKEIFKLSDMS